MSISDRVELEAELARVQAALSAAYWRFTRCAKAGPPPRALYVRRNELQAQLGLRIGGRA